MPLDLPPATTRYPMRTSSLQTLPPADAAALSSSVPSTAQQQHIVTLAHVRYGPRHTNEYVDSPRPLPILPLKSSHIGLSSSEPPSPTPGLAVGSGQSHSLPCRTSHRSLSSVVAGGGGGGVSVSGGGDAVVSAQPSKSPPPPLKEEGGNNAAGGGERGGEGHSSIMCTNCGKCRCAACAEPRELPSKWCCGDRYEVSARRAVDICTCFCCVQATFYHCGTTEGEDNSCYDEPCACGGKRCFSRWACLTFAGVFLPCLWCYWPMRKCLDATTRCYNGCCRKKGCQCSKRPAEKTATHSQTRRLLIESDSSSA